MLYNVLYSAQSWLTALHTMLDPAQAHYRHTAQQYPPPVLVGFCPARSYCQPSDRSVSSFVVYFSLLGISEDDRAEESDLTTMKLILTSHEGSSSFTTRNISLDSTGQVTVLRSSPQQGRLLSAVFPFILQK